MKFSFCGFQTQNIAKEEEARFQQPESLINRTKNVVCRPPPPPQHYPPPWKPQPLLHPCTTPLLRAQLSPPRRQRRRRRRSRWRRRRRRRGAAAAAEPPPWSPQPMSQRTLALWSWEVQGVQLYQFECILWVRACVWLGEEGPTGTLWCTSWYIHPVVLTLCHLLSYFLSWH